MVCVVSAAADDPQFTVDTGLFRQLGELLVGRDSTALVEMIKNAYDADATSIVLRGEHLDDPEEAVLTVADNGTGMTAAQFRRGFLRLAARGKTAGDRRSPVYRRRYTGEKGVGRLAAHKLAAVLDVTSVAAVHTDGEALAAHLQRSDGAAAPSDRLAELTAAARSLVVAQIDWDLVEQADTLGDVKDGLRVNVDDAFPSASLGTTLTLSRLRHTWLQPDLRDVARQLHNFEPPAALASPLPPTTLAEPLLFVQPDVRDAHRHDPGLTVELEGDFDDPEDYWVSVHAKAEWVLEIRAARGADVTYALAPTRSGLQANQFAQQVRATLPHPAPEEGPFFDARILLRPGAVPTLEGRWTELNSGIRVYLEGFRVLPYGEPRNDWLSLDFDVTKRGGRFQIDPLLSGVGDDLSALRALGARDVSLRLLPNRAFFGAVFLTEDGAGGLRTLVNREGFVPDATYQRLVELVAVGLRLLHRARAHASHALAAHLAAVKAEAARAAAAKAAEEAAAAAARAGDVSPSEEATEQGDDDPGDDDPDDDDPGDDHQGDDPSTEDDEEVQDLWAVVGRDGAARGAASQLFHTLVELRLALGLPDRASHAAAGSPLVAAVGAVEEAADRLVEDTSLLRVLASIGAQLTAFTHEVAQLIPAAVAAEDELAPARGRRQPAEVVHAHRTVTDIRRALERQASYLVDVASTEGRRRRVRQRVAERVDVAFLGFQGVAAARGVELVNAVPADVRTPPLFRAELQAVLTNLLSNAIKAAGTPGRVEVSAEPLADGTRILVQNTGVAVDPEEAEGWFVPYASTTAEVDPVLGQGMGLGLPITRDLVSEYGGTVRFVAPSGGWATAIEVVIPE
jgi:signal transduction histidine kinase